MGRWILIAGIVASSIVFSASALAQAVAESVLTHGLSSAAGTTAGTALGRATNQAAGQLAGKLGQQTSSTVPRLVISTIRPGVQKQMKVLHPTTAAAQPANGGSVNGGSMIASIQGAAPQETTTACAPTTPTPAANVDAKSVPAAGEKLGNCAPKQTAPIGGKDQATNSYQSVITLPAAK
jgi:hypothetical protein